MNKGGKFLQKLGGAASVGSLTRSFGFMNFVDNVN